MENIDLSSSSSFLRNLYARMLLTRMVDECACKLYEQGYIGFVASCCGYEAAQVGSAVCIEVGKDFTLPYYRDLGVVLTIGMTPYEIFRTYLSAHGRNASVEGHKGIGAESLQQPMLHWGYSKHNMVSGAAPVATQILHAAGIAFASKLRKAEAVTVAFCGDGAVTEPDFLEGITFAAQHELPVVFICEQDGSKSSQLLEQEVSLPAGLEYRCIDGSDALTVYGTMQDAMQYARDGRGPVLLEMRVSSCAPGQSGVFPGGTREVDEDDYGDPLRHCQQLLKKEGSWDEEWATQLYARTSSEVEQALEDALRDVL